MYYKQDVKLLSKNDLYEHATELLEKFIKANKLKSPKVYINFALPYCGMYTYKINKIKINLSKCVLPTTTPGFKWSYPGYKADLTPIGVLSHELGHYVHHILDVNFKEYRKFIKGEKRVSSYEPNIEETFAESFKVFLTNPDLLKRGRHLRYSYLTEVLNLKPVISESYESVLSFAHEKFISAAQNWSK